MTPIVTTYYDDLGVTSDASGEDLRRAYRGLARRLHPDVNDNADSEQMRRLNRAWAVLGDPVAREEYDRALRQPAGPPITHQPAPMHPPILASRVSSPLRWLRPSTLALAVLLLLFIVTAYAGPRHTNAPATPTTTGPPPGRLLPAQPSTGFVESALVGKCLLALPGYDAIVSCLERSDGVVLGETTRSADCPAGTTVHQLAGQSHFVCLAGRTP